MVSDFNIRDSNWDTSYSFHSSYSDTLVEIVDSFDLTLSSAIQQVPTWYSDNENNSNLVIDLLFLQLNFIELNNHEVYLELWFLSDHAPLTVNIIIKEEFIPKKKYTIIKNSKEELDFMKDFIRKFGSINTMIITNKTSLESIVQEYADIVGLTWNLHSQ